MIQDDDEQWWGTAKQLREHTQLPISDAMLQHWVARKGLRKVRGRDAAGRPCVIFPLVEVAAIWRAVHPSA
ncbi:hypothetical protein GCM10010435_44220 [Winogradskya consettensis]|uniref:Uncharacterized protein n=1 Tax=Winogradskya consettensis TaxID=113560 RepID=A0A919SZY9_9ACTN|nr:hypothetical protein [Actinoplanes consettensis]GIM82656.1 hypothetical protein Aco04nite_82610 [Actinoplanes consettensis]